MFFHVNTIKNGQTMTYIPNTIFSCQTTLKKAKFLQFGLKNANLATLVQQRRSLAVDLRATTRRKSAEQVSFL